MVNLQAEGLQQQLVFLNFDIDTEMSVLNSTFSLLKAPPSDLTLQINQYLLLASQFYVDIGMPPSRMLGFQKSPKILKTTCQ